MRSRLLPALVVALGMVGCPESHGGPSDAPDSDAGAPSPLGEREELLFALDRGEERVVLLVQAVADPSAVASVAGRQRLHALLPATDWVLEARTLPIVAVRLRDRETLAALEADPFVVHVEPDRAHTVDAIPSLEMIGQPAALSRGADGRGRSVAVLDTGVDFRRAAFGSCSAPGPGCSVVYAQDFAPSDGMADDPASMHGTNVAGIVHLVAPSAGVIALDVFSGSLASSVHITAAIDWVIANRATYGIAAVNMSLGYGGFGAPCPTDVLAVAVQRLRDAGIVPVVASANNGYTNLIASPACAPAALSVGAVGPTGAVASFSNSASFLTMLAPGVSIDAAGITMSGTSQAAPHVAGSVAALLSAYPDDGPSALIARLVGTGVDTVDARNGLTFRRLSLDAATAGGAIAPPPDLTAPNGTLTLAGPYTNRATVAFMLSATDPSGVSSMCVSAATSCTTFVPFASSGTLTLPTGDGLKTVRAWLRDGAGNTTATPPSAAVTLDTRAPTAGTLTAQPEIGAVRLSLSGASDAGSGIVRYRLVYSTTTSAPSSCAVGTLVSELEAPSFAHEGLVVGTTYRYRMCGIDAAGNASTGATASAMAVRELDPPSGTVVIDGGATWARSTRVTLTLTAVDASRVSHVCLSTGSTCTSFVALPPGTPTMAFTLATGSGPRPVYARFRDEWGNVSLGTATDTILLDTTMPPSPVVSVARSDGQLSLSWAEGTDVPSGLAGYTVAFAEGVTAPACATGVAALPATGGVRRHALLGLVNGRSYAFRVCAVDVAGNVSSGTTGTAIPAPELVPPTPVSLVVAGGAAWTRSSLVGVALGASDASGVTSMCLSTTSPCTAWAPYSSSVTFTLGTTAGSRTVNAWFRDAFGNATPSPISDTVGFDASAPSNPTVSAVARPRAVEISFGPSTDAHSGVAGYIVATSTGTASPPCAGGTTFGPTELRLVRVEGSSTVRFRVCAFDVAGNWSAGATGSVTPLP